MTPINTAFRLLRFGSAKTLTQAGLPFGKQEPGDISDRYV